MNPTYVAKLGLVTWKTDVGMQKIDSLTLVTYRMVLVGFSSQNKLWRVWCFEETFLLADTSMEIVLGILFVILSDADVQFVEKKLEWKSYTTTEALPITKKVELINKKEFVATALDKNAETFVVYVAILSVPTSPTTQVYPFR